MKTLFTRRMIGFYIAAGLLLIKPEIAEWVVGLYGLLIGIAVTDSIKGGRGNG